MAIDFDRLKAALADRYAVQREIGQGGMAIVYLAEDLKHHRKVAIKVLRPELAATLGAERFLREIETAAKLNHPHILTLHDSGKADGFLYYVMPYVEGESLRQRLEREGQLPIGDALLIAREVADGLGYAHRQGLVHRDIKPGNILLSENHAVIADFGIAKAIAEAGGDRVTETGLALGSPTYMSPEQASGDQTLDGRSDLYSLGCVLYEMLAGEPTFKGRTAQAIMAKHLVEAAPSIRRIRPDVPVAVEQSLLRTLNSDPSGRFADAQSFGRAIKLQPTAGETLRSFVADLWRRRVPQILAIYLVVSWLVIRLSDWLINRYVLSPHIWSFTLTGLVLLLPAVCILAYFHGVPEKTSWSRTETVGLPAYMLGVAVVLFFVFSNKDLGSATTIVALTDEEGNVVERVVPKSEFSRSVALFYFKNESEDSTLNWLQYGFTIALAADLEQDLFIGTVYGFQEEARRAGSETVVGLPLALERQIARDNYLDYFLTGVFTKTDRGMEVATSLYRTRTGKKLAERQISGDELFAIVDDLTELIKRDLDLPQQHIEDTPDLPASEVLTVSLSAFGAFVAAKSVAIDSSPSAAHPELEASLLEDALGLDSTFALAWHELARLQLRPGRQLALERDSMAAIEAALRYSYRLPDEHKRQIRRTYYRLTGDDERLLALDRMHVQLHPDDAEARFSLAEDYADSGRFEEAIEVLDEIVAEGPDSLALTVLSLRLGEFSQKKGDHEAAIIFLEMATSLRPGDSKILTGVAINYLEMSETDRARQVFQQVLLLDPNNVTALHSLADLDFAEADFDRAHSRYRKALALSRAQNDSVIAGMRLYGFYFARGQIDSTLKYWEFVPVSPPRPAIWIMVEADRLPEALQAIEDMELARAPTKQVSLMRMQLYETLEDPDSTEKYLRELVTGRASASRLNVEGNIARMRGDCTLAMAKYKEAITLEPAAIDRMSLARCHISMGDYDEAEILLDDLLALDPMHTTIRYEKAVLYQAKGDLGRAVEQLENALEIWEPADSGYIPAQKARELHEELMTLQ